MERAFEIQKSLEDQGFRAFIVGGANRDKLLGITPKDFDVATNATPDEIISLFKNVSVKGVGKSFGVVLVDGVEVATFRTDTCFGLNNKNTVVTFAKTIEEDLSRRDFTFNAIAVAIDGSVVDPFNGTQDAKNRILRFVGDPETRINEDPNRIIRAARLCATLDATIESYTLQALKFFGFLVEQCVAKERIKDEIMKAVMDIDKPSKFFRILHEIDVLKFIFPSLDATFGKDHGPFHGENIFEHCMATGDNISQNKPLIRLVGFLHDVGKVPASSVNDKTGELTFVDHEKDGVLILKPELRNLKFSNDNINTILGLVELHMRNVRKAGPKGVRRLIKRLEEKKVNHLDFLRLRFADHDANTLKTKTTIVDIIEVVRKIRSERATRKNSAFTVKQLCLSGTDIMGITGCSPGPVIGKTLNALLELVLDNPELNTVECLTEEVKLLQAGEEL